MIQKIQTYFTESYKELRKVNWPTSQETVRLTGIVIALSLGVALFLGLLDIGFTYILSQLIT